MKKYPIFFRVMALVLLINQSSCVADAASGPSAATAAYLNALAQKNKTKVISLSCISFEEQAALEVDALLSVGASIRDLTCDVIGEEGDYQQVKCSGSMDLTYNDEVRAIDLNSRIYTMAFEDGQWRVCSYK